MVTAVRYPAECHCRCCDERETETRGAFDESGAEQSKADDQIRGVERHELRGEMIESCLRMAAKRMRAESAGSVSKEFKSCAS